MAAAKTSCNVLSAISECPILYTHSLHNVLYHMDKNVNSSFGAIIIQNRARLNVKVHIGTRRQMVKMAQICSTRYVKNGLNLGPERAKLAMCRDKYRQISQSTLCNVAEIFGKKYFSNMTQVLLGTKIVKLKDRRFKGIVHLNIIFSYMKFNKICRLDQLVY